MHSRKFKSFYSRTTEAISINLATKHSWVNGIQVKKGPRFFQRGDNNDIAKIHKRKLKKNSSCPEPICQFQPNFHLHKAFLGEEASSLLKWKATLFSKGRLLWNSKNTLTKFKDHFLQNHLTNFNQICRNVSLREGDSRFSE